VSKNYRSYPTRDGGYHTVPTARGGGFGCGVMVVVVAAVLLVMLVGGGLMVLYEKTHHLDRYGFPIQQHHSQAR
jgi:hypothetical protein